jgi:phospholipid/cholesterol/gamma-HCH transport system ATP-binding protein
LALGLIRPDNGRITVLGEEITARPERELYELRRELGMVFQESALFDSLSVEENVAYRLMEERVPEDEIATRVLEALRFVELEHTLNLFPAELSGGMRRRVAIARAMITSPEVLLYDSPTAGLDPVTSTTIVELLVKQRDVYQSSALLVTHRLQDAFTMATHRFDAAQNQMVEVPPGTNWDSRTSFLVLRDAKKIFEGTAAEIANSDDSYIRQYLNQ